MNHVPSDYIISSGLICQAIIRFNWHNTGVFFFSPGLCSKSFFAISFVHRGDAHLSGKKIHRTGCDTSLRDDRSKPEDSRHVLSHVREHVGPGLAATQWGFVGRCSVGFDADVPPGRVCRATGQEKVAPHAPGLSQVSLDIL